MYEENIGQRIEGGYQNVTDAALFTLWEYQPVSALKIQPGFRYAYNSRFDAPLISSLALRFEPVENLVIRGSYGQGFRAPSLKELYFLFVDENHNILGNENLKAETSNNYQLGINFAQAYEYSSISAGLDVFFNDINNEIRLVSVIEPDADDPRGLFENRNVAKTQTTGITFNLSYKYKNLEFKRGFSLVGVRNNLAFSEEAGENNLDGFNFYPQVQFNISYSFEELSLIPSLFINHTGTRTDLATNTEGDFVNVEFESFTMADFTIQKQLFDNKLNLTLGVKNLLDITDISANQIISGGAHSSGSSSIPMSYGRNFFVRLQLRLQ